MLCGIPLRSTTIPYTSRSSKIFEYIPSRLALLRLTAQQQRKQCERKSRPNTKIHDRHSIAPQKASSIMTQLHSIHPRTPQIRRHAPNKIRNRNRQKLVRRIQQCMRGQRTSQDLAPIDCAHFTVREPET
jgi:hypothetical protein